MVRTRFLARTALGLALSLGFVAGAGLTATPAFAKKAEKPAEEGKLTPSKAFAAVAAPYGKALETAKVRPDVVAARQKADAAQALVRSTRGPARKQAQVDFEAAAAALGATLVAERTQLEAVVAAVSTPDDRYFSGQYAYQIGRASCRERV